MPKVVNYYECLTILIEPQISNPGYSIDCELQM